MRRSSSGLWIAAALLALTAPAASRGGEIRLREVSEAWGIDFRHHHGGSGERYMVETMVGGLVMFDYDRDGDEDLYFVDGDALPGYEGETPRSRLFRNDGPGRFVDVTEAAGVGRPGYGCGGSAADFDGDGDPDLYVTVFGVNRLYRNRGDGSFEEVAGDAGVADPRWSAAAAFADTDLDGDLDLYLSNYVSFTIETHKFCGDEEAGLQGYCHPGAYDGVPDALYENRGDGTFVDATATRGLDQVADEAGLGVVIGDLDHDGWPDIYVANDADPNFLFRNRGDGSFEDWSLLSGTAYSTGGSPEAGMGVDLGDVDGDHRMEIVVTNFELETNALYGNTGGGVFIDRRFPSGVAEPSLLDLAFGVALADLDHDRDLDLVVANGHILDNAKEFNENSRYEQVNSVLANDGSGRFSPVDAGLTVERASRGLVAGDLDGDGDLDVAINNSNARAEVYENLAGSDSGAWLLVDLLQRGMNRLGVGARLEVEAQGTLQVREVRTSSSYLSQSSLTQHFGLGGAEAVSTLAIEWPGGGRLELRDLPVNRRVVVVR